MKSAAIDESLRHADEPGLIGSGEIATAGVIAGALLLTLVANGLIQLNIDPYWTQFFSGLMILAAGGVDRLRGLNVERLERAERFALANEPAPPPKEA